ncbi:glycosyltransferase family 4 protein [Desulfogranum mediterraneum]|uniref:glycosyltransferase family 4 protein n=1 Tax=Desulfogranum mediterraneum TaxID=160661 RepID=UPI00040A8E96|nr:glycosyltransferase family 4 protein [Desulfogranum mediterraneum]
MKVWLLIWDYWPGLQGGSERQARMVAQELFARDVDCEIITSWSSWSMRRLDYDGKVRILRLGTLAPLRAGWQRVVRRFLSLLCKPNSGSQSFRKNKVSNSAFFWLSLPLNWISRLSFMIELFVVVLFTGRKVDVIHLHEPSWLGGVAQIVSNYSSSAILCQEATTPALPVIGYDVPFRRILDRQRRLPWYIAMTAFTQDELVGKGIREDRIFQIPNGVHLPSKVSRSFPDQVLYVGNLTQGSDWKAFDVLFKAWCIVAEKNHQARLTVVGGGDSSEWVDYLVENKCTNSVTFVGRVDDPGKYYCDASLFVLPSRVEGLSNALIESQSWGIPAVVSDIPGNMAVITDGENGVVTPVGNAEKFAEAILTVLSDNQYREKMARVARRKAEEKYDIRVVMGDVMKAYSKISKINLD